MTKRFKNAYDALVKAFYNDHLAYQKCTACAVGNIVAHAHGIKIDKDLKWRHNSDEIMAVWIYILDSSNYSGYGRGKALPISEIKPHILKEIFPTGYTPAELAKIEQKFAQLSYPDRIDFEGHVDISGNGPKPADSKMLYELIEFIAFLDGNSLELESNPFETTEMLAYGMVTD